MRTRWPGRVALASVMALALAAGGCATDAPAAEGDVRARSVTVMVENNNWQDATIYVVGYGPRARLGTVTSLGSGWFRVPPSLHDPTGLQLRAELIGSRQGSATGRIMARPGDVVRWTLENQLALSSYSVR